MKKNKLAIIIVSVIAVALLIIGVIFAAGKSSHKDSEKDNTAIKTTGSENNVEVSEEANNAEIPVENQVQTENGDTTTSDIIIKWPTDGYTVTLYYGEHDILGTTQFHSGIDIASGEGADVYAVEGGTIVTKAVDSAYGNYILINHNNGYYTLYAQLKDFASVNEGDTVTSGQVIGYVGMTGNATGPHLHFEVRTCPEYSCTVDPIPFLNK